MKKTMKSLLCLLLALVMVLGMTACGGKSTDDAQTDDSTAADGSTEAAASGTTRKDPDTLTVAVSAAVNTLDPHQANLAQAINALNPVYETLVRYDENGELQGLLAESWEQIDDLSWQFNLRHGVKFHNGEEMKASDVLFSIQRATGDKGVGVSHVMYIVDGEACEAPDDYTVIIRTKEPFAPFLTYMTFMGACVVSEKEFTEDEENAMNNPCGTGPFKFESWIQNDRTTYVRNDEYWGEKPAYKNLVIRTIVEANSRVIELKSGTVDIAYEIPATEIAGLESNSDTKIASRNSTTYEYLGMNCSKEPFSNPEFRKAIAMAIDFDSMVTAVYGDSAAVTRSPVNPGMIYSISDQLESRYDPEAAKAIIDDLGLSGTTYKLTTWNAQHRVDCATIMQSMLKEVGINIEIDAVELATWSSDLGEGNTDFFIAGFGAIGFPDPDMNIYGPLHKDQVGISNYCFYVDDTLSELLDQSRSIKDGPDRQAVIEQIQQMVYDEAPMLPYANTMQVIGLRSDVQGFVPTAAQNHFVQNVYFG